jgi:hypothetical protein
MYYYKESLCPKNKSTAGLVLRYSAHYDGQRWVKVSVINLISPKYAEKLSAQIMFYVYRISSNSFHRNCSFLNLTLSTVTFDDST